MPQIQFGFTMPADQLDKARRTTFVADLQRSLTLISGHFDSAWVIDHLQFGDADVLEGFTPAGERLTAVDSLMQVKSESGRKCIKDSQNEQNQK